MVLVAVGGCAPTTQGYDISQQDLAREEAAHRVAVLTQTADNMRRLHEVGGAISFRAAYLCGENVRPQLGLIVWNQYSFDGLDAEHRSFWDDATPWRDAAADVLGVSEALRIGSVVPGSPAANAGLMPGDTVLAVDGKKAPTGEDAAQELYSDLEETVTETDRPVRFEIERGGQRMMASVRPQDACDFPITLQQSPMVNAFADGTNVVVTMGMMRFAQSDDELAVVVGHEIAHNYMGHLTSKRVNAAMGAAGGLALDILAALAGVNTGGGFTRTGVNVGAGAFSQEFEAEADYAGLYATSAADFDISAAPEFWRRMSVENPRSIEFATTHPTNPYRAAALRKVIDEIAHKRVAGLPLAPTLKPPASANAGTKLEPVGLRSN